ncbi:MAG TPA: phytanoyl-CoA dioxygenase family protein [Candidatus Acidoferrales bacterium]|nr:phytanoyl-CoA dioxygenase family protein [Candidatus Acidoferrales bacterium]
MTKKINRTPVRTLLLAQATRRGPRLYSAIFKARLLASHRDAAANPRDAFRRNQCLFEMDDLEKQQVESLRNHGYALAPGFFSKELVDRIYAKADAMFHNLQIDGFDSPVPIRSGGRAGLSYADLAAKGKTLELRDPLVHIPEVLDIVFHESLLKITGHFLSCVPTMYRAAIVRDFPHNDLIHATHFERDNDESDSLRIFIDLVDIDDTRGPLVYIPRSSHSVIHSRRPRLWRNLALSASDGRLSEQEVERMYPRRTWVTLLTERGSIAAIHRNGIHKSASWRHPPCAGAPNKTRTAIRLDVRGYKADLTGEPSENRMRKYNFDRMSELQRLFVRPAFVDDPEPALSRAG